VLTLTRVDASMSMPLRGLLKPPRESSISGDYRPAQEDVIADCPLIVHSPANSAALHMPDGHFHSIIVLFCLAVLSCPN